MQPTYITLQAFLAYYAYALKVGGILYLLSIFFLGLHTSEKFMCLSEIAGFRSDTP